MERPAASREAEPRPLVLVVDDDAAMCELVEKSLRRTFEITWTTDPTRAIEILRARDVRVLLTDFRMKGMTGAALCATALEVNPDLPVVVMTAFGSVETAVESMRAGAFDYVTKPIEMQTLGFALERAARARRLGDEVKRLRLATGEAAAPLMGASPPMHAVREVVSRLAKSDVSVLVTGESGTGKEVTARAIHAASERKHRPFVAINCAAVPEALLESELFGHVRGAFTDARNAHPGLFAQADGGTLFLDEVGDMPLALQPKLLRALQERTVRPVGGTTEVAFDVRVISATHRNLEDAIDTGSFREDLFYRLNVVDLALPPLRARGDDVLLLATHFLGRFAEKAKKPVRGFGRAVAEKLLAYGWPGNVRELSNAMERAIALTAFEEIVVDDLPERVRSHKKTSASFVVEQTTDLVPLAEIERRYIEHAYELLGKNRSLTAQTLRIDRKTLYRKLQKAGEPEEP